MHVLAIQVGDPPHKFTLNTERFGQHCAGMLQHFTRLQITTLISESSLWNHADMFHVSSIYGANLSTESRSQIKFENFF